MLSLYQQGTHESLRGNAKALSTVTAIIDGTGSIGMCGMKKLDLLIFENPKILKDSLLSLLLPNYHATHDAFSEKSPGKPNLQCLLTQ